MVKACVRLILGFDMLACCDYAFERGEVWSGGKIALRLDSCWPDQAGNCNVGTPDM
jgi:hypothetical protein